MRHFQICLLAAIAMLSLLPTNVLACRYMAEQLAQESGEMEFLGAFLGPDPLHLVAPSRPFDTEHIRLDLEIDFDNASVSGSVTQRLRSLRPQLERIQLNCVEINVHSVSIAGVSQDYEYPVASEQLTSWMLIDDADASRQTLLIKLEQPLGLGEEVELHIEYDCSPQTGLYFQPGEAGQYTEVWSQGEGESNRYWIPCFDYPNDKASFEGIFRVPQGYFALSNGELVSREALGDLEQFHWRLDEPQVSYLITLAAAEYEVYEDHWNDVELLYVCPPGTDRETALRCMGITSDVMECFTEVVGLDYPYGKYAQVAVQNFIFGGMENTTASTMHAKIVYDEGAGLTRNETDLIAHELAHQWWGDMVTMREWNHMWLNEGFAKYFEEIYREWQFGDDELRVGMNGSHRSVIRADKRSTRPMVTDFYNRTDNRNNANIYVKGASVLHMLRGMVGDELFYSVLRHYGNKHRFDFAETPDLATAVKEVTGENLDWFFEQWVYMAGHPVLEVSQKWDRERGNLALTIAQTQEVKDLVSLFRLPMQVEVCTASGTHLYEILVDKDSEVFNFPVDTEPLMVVVDKGDWLLKELNFERSREQWLYMLEHGDGPSRLQAIRALEDGAGDDPVFAALVDSIHSDPILDLRLEALDSLSELRDERMYGLLLQLMEDDEARLRRDSAGMLRNFKGREGLAERLILAIRSDPAWDVKGRALDSLVAIGHDRDATVGECMYLIDVKGDRHNMVRSGLNALDRLRADEHVDMVRELAAAGNSRDYRHTAISTYANMMSRLEEGRRKAEAAEFVAGMLHDPWSRTRQSVIGTLSRLKVRDSIEPLRSLAEAEEVQWLADYAHKTADEIDSFREERVRIEDLETQISDMQRQLQQLQQTVNDMNRERQESELER